jgi:tRNA pseudouridine55 synthase
LLVDKPSGPTSHDVVDAIRRRFRIRKVGHGGTLDPLATGLLILLTGRGTRLANRFIGSDKTYRGVMRLGIATDTQDAQGQVIREGDPSAVTAEQVVAEMQKLTGDIHQMPPMVSAVKVQGVPLYKRARKGQVVEREPRLIHVYRFSMDSWDPPRAGFTLECTKGTYVRTLCADIGEALGCGAHLESLCRTRSGEFGIERAHPLADLMKLSEEEFLQRIVPIRDVIRGVTAPPPG